ncbi:YrdB family protein [Kitasatospora sp. NBC_01287]|uniref:YrdB family protein n=1 Tax=Kitasatospora sp. NBC_01287 TaxID=2903573 RepID=UPI002254C35D|nr:YrdB family protein [Kitasatospora sp. NBC_01287]MCX4747796.1 YrdB family protein [Kitasatospora sp. NBC_01287]
MVTNGLRALNDVLAFFIELAALGFLAWWGYRTGPDTAVHLLLAIGLPLLAAVLWGRYAAPRASVKLPVAGVLLVKALVFGAGALALGARAGWAWGVAFGALALVNTALVTSQRNKPGWQEQYQNPNR